MAEQEVQNLDKNNKTLTSNEELVDSLVEEIIDVQVKDDADKNDCNQSDTNNSKVKEDNINIENVLKEPEEDTQTDADLEEDDFIDEVHLKDLELEYTEEDRQRLKGEAEQLKVCGNNYFKAGEFKEAAFNYTKALRLCPLEFSKDRAVLYANRGAAKVKLNFRESAIEDCSKAVDLDAEYLKAFLRRAQLYELTDKLDEALSDYKRILEIDPSHKESLIAVQRLPDEINERNEKLKTEMFGKLKDLGNMILKPFGLSTNNFQMVKDPNSGGYSINLTQNPTNHS